jgi:hypothetical protein
MSANKGRVLQIFRDGRRHEKKLFQQLPAGSQGNFETLAVMKKIVVEDSKETDLKAFAMREIIGLDKATLTDKVDAAFYYCRDKIINLPEKDGYETVADLWSCLYAINPNHATGDCALKTVALATCLSYLNLKPYFVAIRQVPGADYFNHVYSRCEINGIQTAFDPTPVDFRPGQETSNLSKVFYRIF